MTSLRPIKKPAAFTLEKSSILNVSVLRRLLVLEVFGGNETKTVAVFDTNSEEALIGTGLLADKIVMIDFNGKQITITTTKK